MIVTYKGTLQTVYDVQVDEELGRTRKTLIEVSLLSEDGSLHDIPEKIETKLRYRIEHGQLKAGDTYEFKIDIPVHIKYLEDLLHGPDTDPNLNPEQMGKIVAELAKWKKELERHQ